jgi:hypothetical protein
MREFLRIPLLVLALVLPLGSVAAQQDQIPKELALALIPFGAAEGGEIILGQMPPDLSAIFTLPPGARVLGSFVSTAYAQVVLSFPGRADSATAYARRALLEHGWTPRSPTISTMGGLQYTVGTGGAPSMYCKPGEPSGLNVTAQFHGPATSLLHVTRNAGANFCDQSNSLEVRQAAARMQEFPLATVPPLWSPGDFRTSSLRCRRTNAPMSDQSQQQPLLTDLSLTDILAHYGRQLDSAGWKPAAAEGESVSKTWSKVIGTRGTQEVTITVSHMVSQAGCYDVSLRATALPR